MMLIPSVTSETTHLRSDLVFLFRILGGLKHLHEPAEALGRIHELLVLMFLLPLEEFTFLETDVCLVPFHQRVNETA